MPRPSGTKRREGSRQSGEQRRLRMAGREGEAHTAGGFNDACCDLDPAQTQRRELSFCEVTRFWNGVPHTQHQPVSGCVQNEPNLIGDRRTARRSIGSQLGFVELDEVLRLSARAIEVVVKPFRRAMFDVGDDEADVEAQPRRLNARDGAALPVS